MTLEIKWNYTDLENTPHPKYLCVTLDRTLSYKKHIHKTKMKVEARNNLLKTLSNSKCSCNTSTIRTALVLSYSAAESACPVWARSPYASRLDPELNDACRLVTRCLRPTNVEELYLLAGLHHLSGKEKTGNKRSPLSTRPDSSRETLEERMLPLICTTC